MTYQLLSPSGWLSRLTYAVGLDWYPDAFPALINDELCGRYHHHTYHSGGTILYNFVPEIFTGGNRDMLLLTARESGGRNGQASRTIIGFRCCSSAFPSILMFLLFVMGSYGSHLLLGSIRSQDAIATDR